MAQIEQKEVTMSNNNVLLPKKQYKRRFEVTEIDKNDLEAVLDMGVASLKGHRAKYPETPDGLEQFKQTTYEYFEYVQNCNKEDDREHKLIPDIESWAVFLGITRMTLLTYEKTRNAEWQDFILRGKDLITAAKKQLIFRQKIPAVIGIFDLTNNSGYVNASEFKLKPETEKPERKVLTVDELPILGKDGKLHDRSEIEKLPKLKALPKDDNVTE